MEVRLPAQPKLFRDPVHGDIPVDRTFVLPLVESPEFQRLRRISQLGTSFVTYHAAEHTRFGHSLGAMHLFERVAGRLAELGLPLPPEELVAGRAAALLHDVGHGPFSHAIEGTLTPGRSHEHWSEAIILGDTALNARLRAIDPSLPGRVAGIIAGRAGSRLVQGLISGQLDVDRMDYLLRDSLFTGTACGRYDLDRLLHVLAGHEDGHLVILHKGLLTAEEYLFARYYMYWQVYFHRTTRGFEHLVRNIWRRAQKDFLEGRLLAVPGPLAPMLRGAVSLGDYLAVDDVDLIAAIKAWQSEPDPVLADLCSRFLHRRLFKSLPLAPGAVPPEEVLARAQRVLQREGLDPDAYLALDRPEAIAYDYYAGPGGGSKAPILVCDARGRPTEISSLSEAIRSLPRRRGLPILYAPAEAIPAIAAALPAP